MSAVFLPMQHFPKLGPDLTDGTPYTTKKSSGHEMNLIKFIFKNAHDMRRGGGGGGYTPLLLRLVGDARRNLTKFWGSSLKVVPRPSEAFLVSFWTNEKLYKCIGMTSLGLKTIHIIERLDRIYPNLNWDKQWAKFHSLVALPVSDIQ